MFENKLNLTGLSENNTEKDTIWVGLLSIVAIVGKEEHWIWSYSDENLTESFWGPNFPNKDLGNTDDCALMVVQAATFWWQDSSCLTATVQNQKVAPICQHERISPMTSATLPQTTTPQFCQQGWYEFEGHCYIFRGPEYANYWLSAEFDCLAYGAHLVSIHSKAEQDFVKNLTTKTIWLGGSDIVAEVGKCLTKSLFKRQS